MNCGDSVTSQLIDRDDEHYYGVLVSVPGLDSVDIFGYLCVGNSRIVFSLLSTTTVIDYHQNPASHVITGQSFETAGTNQGPEASQNLHDCPRNDTYTNRLKVTGIDLSPDLYLLRIQHSGATDDIFEGKYILRVSCREVPIIYELLQSLPISSWSWSDVFDHWACKNPANYSWCAETTDNPSSYVQVDLGTPHTIYSVWTWYQLNPFSWEWVSAFDIQFSSDGLHFNSYVSNPLPGVDPLVQVLAANKEAWKVELDPVITARFLRFVPVEYHNAKRMTINVIGDS